MLLLSLLLTWCLGFFAKGFIHQYLDLIETVYSCQCGMLCLVSLVQ